MTDTRAGMHVANESHTKALELACHYFNKCEELTEILEMFLMDAEVEEQLK